MRTQGTKKTKVIILFNPKDSNNANWNHNNYELLVTNNYWYKLNTFPYQIKCFFLPDRLADCTVTDLAKNIFLTILLLRFTWAM